MLHLAVGRLEIEWGKNRRFCDHSALFQGEADVTDVPYYYAGDDDELEGRRKWKVIIEYKEGLSKPLPLVLDRLNLLGHTSAQCEKEFLFLAQFNDFDSTRFTFTDLQNVLAEVDVTSLSTDYGEGGEDFGKFFRREIAPRLGFEALLQDDRMGFHSYSNGMENLSAYTVLHLLAHNPHAAYLPVQWAFNDIETGGYAIRDEFVRPLDPRARFLIVTEGSSDAVILRHALKLLRPHISDFFHFVDMEEGYPFSGTGNVFRFVQGLISIAIQNKILILFDNDAKGLASYKRCTGLNVPANMRILRLPDLRALEAFPTIGPDGEGFSNINGRAAAIECYLDLDEKARVRWTSYNQATTTYQGELDGKARYMRTFLKQRQRESGYDYSRLDQILDFLVTAAVSISEQEVSKEWHRALEDDIK